MNSSRQRYQGGSTAIFVIIGVILVAGLAGGVYFLKRHSDQVAQDQIAAIIEKQKTADEASKTTTSEEKAKADATTSVVNTGTVEPDDSNFLPTTGPELNISGLFGVCLLAITLANYVQSRRSLVGNL